MNEDSRGRESVRRSGAGRGGFMPWMSSLETWVSVVSLDLLFWFGLVC